MIQQQNDQKQVRVGLHFQVIVRHWRKSGQEFKQGRNLEAGTDAQAMEKYYYWLFLHGSIAYFLIEPWSNTSEGSPHCAGPFFTHG